MIRVDGKTVYACTTRLAEGEMTLEPLPNKKLVKDLVTEIAPPDERLKQDPAPSPGSEERDTSNRSGTARSCRR